jgi:hypothetical protein
MNHVLKPLSRRDYFSSLLKVIFRPEKNLLQNERNSLVGERKLSLPEMAVWSDALIAQ